MKKYIITVETKQFPAVIIFIIFILSLSFISYAQEYNVEYVFEEKSILIPVLNTVEIPEQSFENGTYIPIQYIEQTTDDTYTFNTNLIIGLRYVPVDESQSSGNGRVIIGDGNHIQSSNENNYIPVTGYMQDDIISIWDVPIGDRNYEEFGKCTQTEIDKEVCHEYQ